MNTQESIFQVTRVSLGQIPSGKPITIFYPYKGIREITNMISPCDCSVPENRKTQSLIAVRYVPKEMSQHLKERGHAFQNIEKTIAIYFKTQDDPNTEQRIELSFTAQILK